MYNKRSLSRSYYRGYASVNSNSNNSNNIKKYALALVGIMIAFSIVGHIETVQSASAYKQVSDTKTAEAAALSSRRAMLEAQEQHVYDVCNASRMVVDDAAEEKCGQLQTDYNMTFYCKQNNQAANSMCWVEYNGGDWNGNSGSNSDDGMQG